MSIIGHDKTDNCQRACAKDPTVQRAYAECAEGYGFKIDPCPPYDHQKRGIVEAIVHKFLP